MSPSRGAGEVSNDPCLSLIASKCHLFCREAFFSMVFPVTAKTKLCSEKPRLLTGKTFLSTANDFVLTANSFLFTAKARLWTANGFLLTAKARLLTANSFLSTAKARLLTANSFLLSGRKAPCAALTKPRNGVVASAKRWSKEPANRQNQRLPTPPNHPPWATVGRARGGPAPHFLLHRPKLKQNAK